MSPAIVVITYNRPQSLRRLLNSIYNANYEGYSDIPLVISIDGGSSSETQEIVEAFDWQHGDKRVILHEENLGLRKHVICCGNLSEEYGSIIVLEDDLFVSPYFYDYASKATLFYKNEEKIAGISLFSYGYNEYAVLPYIPLQNGYDVFFMQVPSSWGQTWTKKQWKSFMQFYDTNPVITDTDKLPDAVKKWPETSWKKYFYKYIVTNNLYFVYPYISYSTNFGDKGTHYEIKTSLQQVRLMNNKKNYLFPKISEVNIIYDAYMELLPECFWGIGIKRDVDFCVDVYGTKQLELFENEYCFSVKDCSNPIEQNGIELIPIENNIICRLTGNQISFSKRINFKSTPINYDIYFRIAQLYSEVIYNISNERGYGKGYEVGYEGGREKGYGKGYEEGYEKGKRHYLRRLINLFRGKWS